MSKRTWKRKVQMVISNMTSEPVANVQNQTNFKNECVKEIPFLIADGNRNVGNIENEVLEMETLLSPCNKHQISTSDIQRNVGNIENEEQEMETLLSPCNNHRY